MNRYSGEEVKDWHNLIGHRAIVVEKDDVLGNSCEVTIEEVSTSGRQIKLLFPSGSSDWEWCKNWFLIEDLGVRQEKPE